MKSIIIRTISICMLLLSAYSANAVEQGQYLLKQGDILDISVWGDESLNKELLVLPDGSISFPLAGRVEVAGWPASAVEKIITGKLKKFLQDPVVTIIIKSTQGSRVYVLGKISKPGPILLSGPMTVLQALSIAGGFDKFADLDAIKIIRKSKGKGEYKVLPVDYTSLLKGIELHNNHTLKADDTILVP